MSKQKKWFGFNKNQEESKQEDPSKKASSSQKEGEESTASIVEDVFREAKEKASKKAARRAEEAAKQAEEERRRRENQHEIMLDRDQWLVGFASPMLALEGVKELNYDCILRKTEKEKQLIKKRMENDFGITEFSQMRDVIRSLLTPYPADEDPILNAVDKLPVSQWREAFVNADLCSSDHVDNAIEDIRFALQGMRNQNFAPPIGTLRAWDYARAAYLTLVGYGMGIIPKHEVIMILTRVSLLANWFYNSWDQYTSAFVFGRRVSLALAGKRYDWDDRDLKAIIPLLRERESNYIMHPIAFGITDYQRQNYSLRFRLVRDGEVLDEHHNKVSEKVIEENIHGLEARQGSFFTIMPNMMLMETNQMVIARVADEAPKAESGEENGQDEQAPQGPVYLVELQFPKKKFVLACAHLFTEEQAVEIAKDYCIHFRLPNISDWQSLTRTWEEVRASQSGEETTDSFDTPAQEQDGQDAGQAEEEEKTSEGGGEESAAKE